jgi:tripartite-type tricarboxylate transporter receptor subunit TctC
MRVLPVLLVLAAAVSGAAAAQTYPTQPIRIVTSEASGGNDLISRLIAQGIAGPLGQPVSVDNRPAGVVPGEIVAKAPADGYTLLIYNNTLWVAPLMRDAAYVATRDFAPIAALARTPNVVVVPATSAITSISELIAAAKARPGELRYGVSGMGAGNHLAGELLAAMAGIRLVPVVYKGAQASVSALYANETQLMFPTAVSATPHVKSGKLRALGVTSAQPSALMPGVAPVAASGLPGYEAVTLFVAFAPAATPRAVVTRLNDEILRYLNAAGTREKIFDLGMETIGSSPEQLAATMKSELTRMEKVIREAGIRIE